ncbi:EF hand domain containing 1, isoform CRA_b [Mus musculus]|nr:EF hand domain containing 1, isoform CRA_b [Mus musculus]
MNREPSLLRSEDTTRPSSRTGPQECSDTAVKPKKRKCGNLGKWLHRRACLPPRASGCAFSTLKKESRKNNPEIEAGRSQPQAQALSCSSKFEAELKAEQEERKREEEARRLRQAAFRELKAAFSA